MHGLAQQPDRLNTIEEHFFRALRRAHLVPDNTEGKRLIIVRYPICVPIRKTQRSISSLQRMDRLDCLHLSTSNDADGRTLVSLPSLKWFPCECVLYDPAPLRERRKAPWR